MSNVNLDGFANAAPATSRGARFQAGRYFYLVSSFASKQSEQDNTKMLYIVDGTILKRLSDKGNEPSQHVSYVMQKGDFANAQQSLMRELKAAAIGLTGLSAELNDPAKAVATMTRVLKENLASGRVVEVLAELNDKGTFTRPSFLRVVPAAEWSGVVEPKILAELFGGGNEDTARAKIGSIIDRESKGS